MSLKSPFPAWAFFAAVRDIDSQGALLPEELALLSKGANQSRITQFTLGRNAAHRAMSQAGLPTNTPIVRVGTSRAPAWPKGWIGSIAHTAKLGVAVIASAENARNLGIDIESLESTHTDISSRIATQGEAVWLTKAKEGEALTLFSLKESIYKALAPLTSDKLSFKDVEITPGESPVDYIGSLTRPIVGIRPNSLLTLLVSREEGFLLTGCIVSD